MIADPTSPGQAAPTATFPAGGWNRLTWVLGVALLARLAAMAVWPQNLTDDRDGYLQLADGLVSGRGFAVPESELPTAYRPPLYPLLLLPAAVLPSALWVAALHLVLGVATVWLTWVLALRLTAQPAVACMAAGLVAIDPLLLRYTTFPMTETLAACLVTGLLVVLAGGTVETSETSRRACRWRSVLAGVLFGLAALCRPTVWAFAALAGVWKGTDRIWRRLAHHRSTTTLAPDEHRRIRPLLALAAAVVVLLPWGARNWLQFGRPILMTTHGGYTLLLGNNPHFVREVVDQPWGTVWDGSRGGGQAAWADSINRQMDEAGITGEVARDRWMRDRAIANIAADPSAFARAGWLRLRRFWGLMPTEGASDQPAWVRRGIGAFYAVVFLGVIAGATTIARHGSRRWMPSLLMVLAFTGVHLVYWTNIRMRAPIVPVLAILTALGWCRLLRLIRRNLPANG